MFSIHELQILSIATGTHKAGYNQDMKRALITGIAGQDGSYMAELLLSKGYHVFGLVQEGGNTRYVPQGAKVTYGDLRDPQSLTALVAESQPDEVYNLAGITDLKTAYEQPVLAMKINYESVGVLLNESIRVNPHVHFLQASSSEIFIPSETPLNEDSPRDWDTTNPYARAKMMADRDFVALARERGGRFACSAILFNHESPRRPEASVLRKITSTLAAIARGKEERLRIGNVTMKRDWGFAPDYVRAMWSMLQMDAPTDLVVATGETHSVQDAITIAAELLGMSLSWQGGGVNTCAYDSAGKKVVAVDPNFYKPAEQYPKVGDTHKIQELTGWSPKTNFTSLIKTMVDSALSS